MRKFISLAAALIWILAPSLSGATVNHGDFNGTGVDFLAVSETTLTADPEPIWGAPTLAGAGDQLLFFPPNFVSQCTSGASDTTTSALTTTISAQGSGTVDSLALAESGDVVLTSFPPFGTAATNASAALSGTLTVTEDISGPIAPVVIPFNGTISPVGSFALPTHFGTNLWSGTIAIDIAGVVPNAKKVDLVLNNALTSNCAPGNTSAKIQKKVVSGPSVAIMVNPVQCDLEIDKTCCVTQPVLPDLGPCEGDLISMTLELTGDKCSQSNNDQGHSFKCSGKRRIDGPANISFHYGGSNLSATPSSGIQVGDEVVITSSNGTLGNTTSFSVNGAYSCGQSLKINTSCEKAFQCGDQFGAFEVTGFESTLGGVVDCDAPPPPPQCMGAGDPVGTPCDNKIIDMVLEYTGNNCDLPNPQGGSATCTGDATGASNVGIVYKGANGSKQKIAPASSVDDGDRVRVTSTYKGGLNSDQKYLITDDSGVLQEIRFNVSCQKSFKLGDVFGSFRVVEFTTASGTTKALGDGSNGQLNACEVPLVPPKPHCTSDLSEITLVYIADYLGAGCTVSNNQSGYADCDGVANPGDPVSITMGSGLTAAPTSLIEFGDMVTITPTSGDDLPTYTSLTTSGAGGTQEISFKSSCHKPLSLGDRFGSWVVFGMDREDDGPISLGGNVQYQYTVTNPNDQAVNGIAVNDSELGPIASGISLAPGQSTTFTAPATLLGTTTNIATVDGNILGDMCTQAEDEVTTSVVVPPQGSFTCSCGQSLTELTLKWNGSQVVDVKVWNGGVGSTLLTTLQDVVPGTKRTVSGFTRDDSTWEVFNEWGTTKLGESKFHLTCADKDMNGVEDCGKNEGDGKYNTAGLINTWILDGMVDDNETLSCSPTVVAPPPMCGFGPELMFVLPGLLWMHRRRLNAA